MKQVFPIAATGGLGTTAVVLGTTAVVLLVVIPLMLLAWYLNSVPRAVRFEVTPEGLRIRGDLLYGRSISRSDLMLDQARSMDLSAEPEYKPKWRTNGTGLPGYQSGWFKLQNGQKALIFVGDSRRVVFIPVRSGYSLLLSVVEPERLLTALRN